MELRQLRTFAMAAELESFTGAAKALKVTQPAVSQQVASLERELGPSLFHRRGRSIKLTDSGRRLYHYARQALDLLDMASQDVGHSPTVITGTLNIASCTLPAETFLPGLITVFRQVYPHVRETVSVSDSATAMRAVESGEADLAFVVGLPKEKHLSAKEIVCHELVLVASPKHRLAACNSIWAEQLRSEVFVFREVGSGTRLCVEQALQEGGIRLTELTVALETNSNDAIRGTVKQGNAIAFMSLASVADDLSHGRLVAIRVNDLHARQSVHLVTDSRRVPTAAVRAFLGFQD